MKLSDAGLADRKRWQDSGYELPVFDRSLARQATIKDPIWIHFGAGNIFRAFPAALQQKLLDAGDSDKGIIVCEGYDYEIIHRLYKPYDDLCLLVVLKPDGRIEKKVIASIMESLAADTQAPSDWQRLREIFRNPSLQMASFTITEKGYSVSDANGNYYPAVLDDFRNGPGMPRSFMGKVSALCWERYKAGRLPLAWVSMDNCSHNGEKLCNAVRTFAVEWVNNGLADPGFLEYVDDPESVSFPWSMIDKITPRPDASIKAMLEQDGFADTEIICTDKKTYAAPFVNAEEPQYLVIEDLFPNGRPPLEKAGVIFTDRETVNRVEKMKVCTCLNPLHTALAVFGCLLGYTSISAEMEDPVLKRLVERIGYDEGLPVVVDPGIIRPVDFLKEVIEVRLPNKYVPDTPQRIATDTSQKIPIRFGETIKAYMQRPGMNASDLNYIPLVFAAWLRYLLGIDDEGRPFDPSPDPLLDHLRKHLDGITLGSPGPFGDRLRPVLSDARLFAVSLYDAGLAEKVLSCFTEMVSGAGAVRKLLGRLLGV
ncbi:MAG: mannitol dehydrogenase family protein [Clostridiaceae bacterium]|nr:mannitol dehydrogenase family protein [Clostridiaceae bacterium]